MNNWSQQFYQQTKNLSDAELVYFMASQPDDWQQALNSGDLEQTAFNGAIKIAIENHNKIALENLIGNNGRFARLEQINTIFDDLEGKEDDSNLLAKLWNIYPNVGRLLADNRLNSNFKSAVCARLAKHMKRYFTEFHHVTQTAHMINVAKSYIDILHASNYGNREYQEENVKALGNYVGDMPFSVQSDYHLKTNGRVRQIIFYISWIGFVSIFSVFGHLLISKLTNYEFFGTILPTIFGLSTAGINSMYSWVGWLIPGFIQSFFSWLGFFGTVVGWALNTVFATPILFASAWVLTFYSMYKIGEFAFANLFATPPDFSPIKLDPEASEILKATPTLIDSRTVQVDTGLENPAHNRGPSAEIN